MAIASLQLALQGEKVLIIVPSLQLSDQVATLLTALTPDALTDNRSVTLTTPQAALQDRQPLGARFSTLMIDEPEAMLAPLPPRHLPPPALKSHPFSRHPPPLASLLDRILLDRKDGRKPRTVWTGAELNGLLKRVIRQRGWASRDALELDFGVGATQRAKADIEAVTGAPSTIPPNPPIVKHVALLVDAFTGEAVPYEEDVETAVDALPRYRSGRPEIEQAIIDNLISYETHLESGASNPTSLVVPPEGHPLDLLAARINQTSIARGSPTSTPMCSVIGVSTGSTETAMRVVSRSAIPGLDIPSLRRIYLVDGLDLSGLSPAQRARGGLKRRLGFYDIVTGRLGRLGSVTAESGGEVISLVVRGSGEEAGLARIRQLANSQRP